jgi:hypothetical protein
MKMERLEAFTGLPRETLQGLSALVMYGYSGDGLGLVGTADSIGQAIDVLCEKLFDEGVPEIEGEPEEGALDMAGEPEAEQALVRCLSEEFLMARTHNPIGLAYLAGVFEERPELRLVVAWEAAAPAQEGAVGIFTAAPR